MKLEKMFGERPYVCNLFALLSVLAVSGYFIDECLNESWVSKGLFIFIISFHMPLLIFLVGAIFKEYEDDRETIWRLVICSLILYALMKLVISIVSFFLDGEWTFSLLSESGAPWIFFSAASYLLLACCLKRVDKRVLLGFSVILALLCGYTETIGDFLVLSRTIVFFPFFILGWIYGIDRTEQITNKKWLRLLGIITLALALFITVRFASYGYLSRPLFAGGNAYATLGGRVSFGPMYRLLSYYISTALSVAVLAVTPRKSFGKYIDSLGTSFVQIYFWHCPVLYVLTWLGAYDRLYRIFGWKLGRIMWVVCALAYVVIFSGEFLKKARACGVELLRNNLCRTGVFILVGVVLLSIAHEAIARKAGNYRTDVSEYQWYGGFYAEEENSLDAVYVGSSLVFTFWEATVAWERYGIAVEPLCAAGQYFEIAEYVIKEGRKSQPDALYIVPINSISREIDFATMHRVLDNMPLSWNKLQLINAAGEMAGWDWADKLEYFFPLIRYHSRWQSLSKYDFDRELYNYKGGSMYDEFLHNSDDVAADFRTTARYAELSENTQKALDSLLDYCDAEQMNVLFVVTPIAMRDEYEIARMNTLLQTVQSRGYPALNMWSFMDDIGLDPTKDYMNRAHANIHGAIKYTDYLARYLVENYGFTDKRGNPAYSSWDDAYSRYTLECAGPNVLDVEWECAPRDFGLSAPELTGVTVNGTELTVNWESTPNADGYRVYRKLQAKDDSDDLRELCWQALATVDADVLYYTDQDREVGRTYFYTVLPYREKDGVYEWGNYDFSGVSGTAVLNAPAFLTLEGTENDLTLTWGGVDKAEGYCICRSVFGKSWIVIADVGLATSYTDTAMLEDVPYLYFVKAYWYDEDGNLVYGNNSSVELWLPELSGPEVELKLIDGVPALSWTDVEGVNGYTIFRKTGDGNWGQISGSLPSNRTEFYDITAKAGVSYSYQVSPYISHGGEVWRYPAQTPEITAQRTALELNAPTILFGAQVGNYVQLLWEPDPNATAYRVYRKAEGSTQWEIVQSAAAENTYREQPPESGSYTYMILGLHEENGCLYFGDLPWGSGVEVTYHPAGQE